MDAVNFVPTDEKIQALGVLGDDLVLAVLNIFPVQLARAQSVNAVFFRGLEMVINLGIEEKRFGRDAANVQARAAELVFFFDQAGLQPKLAGAEGGRVSAGPSADNGNVINRIWQGSAPSAKIW